MFPRGEGPNLKRLRIADKKGDCCRKRLSLTPEITGLICLLNVNSLPFLSIHQSLRPWKERRPQQLSRANRRSLNTTSTMYGGSSSCGQDARSPQDMHDARPSKRPRNVGESSYRNSVQAGPIEDHGMGSPTDPMGRTGRSDGGHNSIVSATIPANVSTPGRGRVDDKNNRKLSCKECRR